MTRSGRDIMTSFRFLQFLLFLLFQQVYSEAPEPVFRAKGSSIEMGYCFGVDYIVVYRASPKGNQLLGNSSADSMPITPPADLQGRIQINRNHQLLGLQIRNLTPLDSGFYRRECWQDQALSKHHTHQLTVCNEEIESKEIILRQDGTAEVLCNSTSIGVEGTFVHWYYETYPLYRPTLFLDSSKSLKPLMEDLQGAVEARDSGALLLLNHSMLNNYQHFHCLVIKGGECLSFQNMYRPDTSENREVFASHGERVVLPCTSNIYYQMWETPLGMVNESNVKSNHMFISSDNKTLDYSLVIFAVDDEHQGEYSCVSPSDEIQYSLIICPKKEPKKIFGSEAGEVSLECDVGPEESVRWYRNETSDTYELLYDSNDETVAMREDLRGRVTLSHNRSSLTLSDLAGNHEGVYYCVVLRETAVLETDDTYEYEYDEQESEEDESSDGMYWDESNSCVFKQETVLILKKDGRRGHVDVTPEPEPEPSPTAGPPKNDSNATVYALGIGLALLLVVAVIAAVIAIKKRRKIPPQQSQADAQSGLNTSNDIKMNVEPSCTDSLAQNDEFNA